MTWAWAGVVALPRNGETHDRDACHHPELGLAEWETLRPVVCRGSSASVAVLAEALRLAKWCSPLSGWR